MPQFSRRTSAFSRGIIAMRILDSRSSPWSAICASIAAAFLAGLRIAAADDARWLEAGSLEAQLKQPVTVAWSKTPLRGSLARFGRAQRVGVFLDRRVDPDQRLELSLTDVPLERAIRRIAQAAGFGVSQIGTSFYFGPKTTTDHLATMAALRREEVGKLPSQAQRRLARLRSWQWNDLATPHELLQELADEGRIEWRGSEQIPHDLWALGDLPPMPWADRATIILAGFGMTFRVAADGNTAEITPWPEPSKIAYQKRYPAGAEAQSLARRIGEQFTQTRVIAQDRDLVVTGLYEDHLAIERLLPGSAKPKRTVTRVTTTEERHSLSVKDVPLRKLLAYLHEKLKLQFEMDETAITAAGISLDQPVAVTTEKATLPELLERIFDGTGLEFKIAGTNVTVSPVRRSK
jgi:hypothetical protein